MDRLKLHETISHTYASVGAVAAVKARPSPDVLEDLPLLDDAALKALWLNWAKQQVALPGPTANETAYQPILESLAAYLLGDRSRMCGNLYILPVRPDVSVIPKEEMYPRWSNLLWCAELETNLQGKYHHGLGQAWSYSGDALLRQPGRRKMFVVRLYNSHHHLNRYRLSRACGRFKFSSGCLQGLVRSTLLLNACHF